MIGIFLGSVFSLKPLLLAFAIIISVLLTVFIISKILRKKIIRVFSIICVFFSLFGSITLYFEENQGMAKTAPYTETGHWAYGIVTSSPTLTRKANHFSFSVKVKEIERNGEKTKTDFNAMLYLKRHNNAAPKLGDRISFFTEFSYPQYSSGNFDYAQYLKTKNIYVTGFTHIAYPEISGGEISISALGRRINRFISESFDKYFGYDADALGIAKGLFLGEKKDLSSELSQNIRFAGFSHIIAVSGLHLSIFIGILCGLLGLVRIKRKIRWLVSLIPILLFSATVGFTPSVSRAAIMYTIFIFSCIFMYQYDSLTALFISAFVILLANPYSLFDISFVLSFASTLSIILFQPVFSKLIGKRIREFKPLYYILNSLFLSLSATLGTAGFLIYYFGNISLAGILANLWIVPICTPVFILGFIICIFGKFLPAVIMNIFLYPAAFGIDLIIKSADILSSISWLRINAHIDASFLIIYYGILTILFYLIKTSKFITRSGQ